MGAEHVPIPFEPIPFEERERANPELCEREVCPECDGAKIIGGGRCTCEECGDRHFAPERECAECGGKGYVSDAERKYREQLEDDRERWERFQRGAA